MPVRLSRYFGVEPSELKSRGVFDGHLGIDNKLFVDPKLLNKRLKIPEFSGACKDITNYFSKVIKLLKASRRQGDVAWLEAEKRMRFKEENGAALGYGSIVVTPSTSSGQALRKEREEWDTHFHWALRQIQGSAIRPMSL